MPQQKIQLPDYKKKEKIIGKINVAKHAFSPISPKFIDKKSFFLNNTSCSVIGSVDENTNFTQNIKKTALNTNSTNCQKILTQSKINCEDFTQKW